MKFLRIQITLFVMVLFLSGCSQNDLSTPTFIIANIENTETPSPPPTQKSTATISPTNTQVNCPPFEIDREIPDPNIPENYVGRHYHALELPIELVFHQGTSLLGGNNNYGFTIITSSETLQMIWFEKLICRNNDGKPFHEILDAAVLPVYGDNDTLAYWYCSIDEINDPEIIALGESQCGYLQLSNIKNAWQLNRQTEKIEPVSTENISCQLNNGTCTPH